MSFAIQKPVVDGITLAVVLITEHANDMRANDDDRKQKDRRVTAM